MTKSAHTLLIAVALATAAVVVLMPGTGSASPIPTPTSWEVVFTSPMDGMSDIYAMKSDGKAVNLTHDRYVRTDVQPHWSPDGSQVLFTRYWVSGGASIMIMRVSADGQKLINLTPSFNRSVQNIDPNWSPDGSRIVFASNRDGNFDLYTMNTEGQKVVRLTKTSSPTANIEPDWAPNGKGVVFSRRGPGQTGSRRQLAGRQLRKPHRHSVDATQALRRRPWSRVVSRCDEDRLLQRPCRVERCLCARHDAGHGHWPRTSDMERQVRDRPRVGERN